jgi:uncharacterized coiled-coil DUF342 family protein
MHEREGLIARIRQLRRVGATTDTRRAPVGAANPDPTELEALQRRINELEQLVQGLQDSVHRESRRLTKRVADLEARTQPAALGEALSRDARERGL